MCALCQEPVRGLMITCLFCGHGGHPAHVRRWFAEHDKCAAGCGCRCRESAGVDLGSARLH